MTEGRVQELIQMGFKRWTKAGKDRLYINAEALGLECDYYKTGNISYATFKGEKISNSQARRYLAAKTYIDVMTGTVQSNIDDLADAARNLAGIE